MRLDGYVIAAGPDVRAVWGGLDYAVGYARRIARGGEWAVFVPACRAQTAGTMMARGRGRRVRWFEAGREALGATA